ncbi:hypothetical protein SF06_06760 [Pseudomonas flexibilis]|uniref:Uncharacterized protein n=1 Tax=Pseudomonas flexibilis TaxID=706570 RepID=A0A1N6W0L0_9PSED|nr:hypothetical protein [Pseudomonas flexibilis]KHL70592.1 hypothetical protein SF06_06760 [Pseudomonas flexibilis]SIQ83667.1 hypothetical protein SAMN05421672_110169 [Pseudomonas flexibilis]
MDARELRFNKYGSVDCELEHPDFGWIPFTASPDDPEKHGRELYERIVAGDFGDIAPYVEPEHVPFTLNQIQELRRIAYISESDPIKNEADYDALVNGTAPDYTAWLAAVAAIKARYPLPAAPEPEVA